MKSLNTANLENFVLTTCEEKGYTLEPYKDLGMLTEEVGEVAREVRRIEDGRQRKDEVEPAREVMIEHLAEEIGDVLFPLIKIASHYGITLAHAVEVHASKMKTR